MQSDRDRPPAIERRLRPGHARETKKLLRTLLVVEAKTGEGDWTVTSSNFCACSHSLNRESGSASAFASVRIVLRFSFCGVRVWRCSTKRTGWGLLRQQTRRPAEAGSMRCPEC